MIKQTWSIIIFCFNEEGSIKKVVAKLQKVLKKIAPTSNEIVIVDDGSFDNSSKIIKKIAKENLNVKIVTHPRNLGIGKALLSGYKKVKFENVCAIPADNQFNSEELIHFANLPDKTFVSFFREVNTSYSLFRNILSLINKTINKIFIGVNIKDVNWVKIYKKSELKKLKLELSSSLIETEICAKFIFSGNKMIEKKSVYSKREFGQSKGASLRIIFQAGIETIKLIRIFFKYKKLCVF